MRSRMAALAAAAALATGLVACGGDDDKKDDSAGTTETTNEAAGRKAGYEQQDRAAKVQLQTAVGGYNRGYRAFLADLKKTGGDLERLKSAIYDYRVVIYEFDKDLRAIEFRDDLVPQVNSILENNFGLIEQLDAIGEAKTFRQAEKMYNAFLKDRGPTVKSINNLLDDLGGGSGGS